MQVPASKPPPPRLSDEARAALEREIERALRDDDAKVQSRERSSRRIRMILEGMARNWRLAGRVAMFGSFSNGFKSGSSDLDVVLVGEVPDSTHSILQRFANEVTLYGFDNVTKIFHSSVPLVKVTDLRSQMEVDFCVNNELGVRNSQLLYTYCEYDGRVFQLGRLVKDWAKRHELVGTADGYLNSYAYMLLVIHYLQSAGVVPNLQILATESVKIADSKWGGEDYWETKFVTDVKSLPPTQNTQPVEELLVGFFHFFGNFDWQNHAVCPRMNNYNVHYVDKKSLTLPVTAETWYVEDPFDLKHNLAGKCTPAGRKRILDCMAESLTALTTSPYNWQKAFPPFRTESYYLKCRISQNVTPEDLLEEFEEFDLLRLHFPKPDGVSRTGQAFLEFASAAARRRAHTKNENYVADCHLQLHYSSEYSLREAARQAMYSMYNLASYKMQREFIRSSGPVMARTDMMMRASAPPFQDPTMLAGAPMAGPMMPPPYGFFGPRGQVPSAMAAMQMARMQPMWDGQTMPKPSFLEAQKTVQPEPKPVSRLAEALAAAKAPPEPPRRVEVAAPAGAAAAAAAAAASASAAAVAGKAVPTGPGGERGAGRGASASPVSMADLPVKISPTSMESFSPQRAAHGAANGEAVCQLNISVSAGGPGRGAELVSLLAKLAEFAPPPGIEPPAVQANEVAAVEVKATLGGGPLPPETWQRFDSFSHWLNPVKTR